MIFSLPSKSQQKGMSKFNVLQVPFPQTLKDTGGFKSIRLTLSALTKTEKREREREREKGRESNGRCSEKSCCAKENR